MGYKLSKTSMKRLGTCHSEIQIVILKAIEISPINFGVACGFRNREDQNKAFNENKSRVQWPNGKHNKLPSLAVDLYAYVDGMASWNEKHLSMLAGVILSIANNLVIKLKWGGHWKDFVDMPHYEIGG